MSGPFDIDRSLPHEKTPLLERINDSAEGFARELLAFHELVNDRGILQPGSDIANRFSLLMGMSAGFIMRLDAKLKAAKR